MDKLKKNTTWQKAIEDDSIQTLEHPLTEMTMAKSNFYETFAAVCDQLDGTDMSSYVDFFFERNPVTPSHLKFVDEDAKQDFLDWAIDEGCMPTVKEVSQGEDENDRKARLEKEREEAAIKLEQKRQQEANVVRQQVEMERKRAELNAKTDKNESKKLIKRWEGYEKLRTNPKAKAEKLERSEQALNDAIDEFVQSFPESLSLLPDPLYDTVSQRTGVQRN